MAEVFINRTLNLKQINYIGFDLDHTLIKYKSENLEKLCHSMAISQLVRLKKYPKELKRLKFNFTSVIRGLVIDKKNGTILKLNRHGGIRMCVKGNKKLSLSEINAIYKTSYVDLNLSQFLTIDTTFSISLAALFKQLIHLKENKLKRSLPSYNKIVSDILFIFEKIHSRQELQKVIVKDFKKYVYRDPSIVQGLERFTKHGKKPLLITNSSWDYARKILDYCLSPYIKKDQHWKDLFLYIITKSRKPSFFYKNCPFYKIDSRTNQPSKKMSKKISPGIYQGGSAKELTKYLKIDPREILYIGDHIYGDVVLLKKESGWRTALVVEELENEVETFRKNKHFRSKIKSLMKKKIPLEKKLDQIISRKIESEKKELLPSLRKIKEDIAFIDKELMELISKNEKTFNPVWGELMRIGKEESFFAYQVERFACIYMSSILDFFKKNPRSYFRAKFKPLAHEIES